MVLSLMVPQEFAHFDDRIPTLKTDRVDGTQHHDNLHPISQIFGVFFLIQELLLMQIL